MDRIPITTPLPLNCYGMEYDRDDTKCQQCPHQTGCVELLGRRRGRIQLSKAKFSLVPELLADATLVDPDLEDLQTIYAQCHWAVYEKEPTDSINRWPKARRIVEELGQEFNCSSAVIISTVMMAYKLSSPDRDFYANMLLSKNLPKKIELYRALCSSKFGYFDTSVMATVTGQDNPKLEDHMMRSECVFGAFILGYKMRVGGDPYLELYRSREGALDPSWLAIEPTYKEVIECHVKNSGGTREQRRHRHSVIQVIRELKRQKKRATYHFQCREKIMPKAIEFVLGQRGFSPNNFEIEDKPITDIGKMWSRLGFALQHFHLLQYIDGDHRAVLNLHSAGAIAFRQ